VVVLHVPLPILLPTKQVIAYCHIEMNVTSLSNPQSINPEFWISSLASFDRGVILHGNGLGYL
jgi:hypothetical protein